MESFTPKEKKSLVEYQYDNARQQALENGDYALEQAYYDDQRTLRVELKIEVEVRRVDSERAWKAKKRVDPTWACRREARNLARAERKRVKEANASSVDNDSQGAILDGQVDVMEDELDAEPEVMDTREMSEIVGTEDKADSPAQVTMRRVRLRREAASTANAVPSARASRPSAGANAELQHGQGERLPRAYRKYPKHLQQLLGVPAGSETMFFVVDTVGDSRHSYNAEGTILGPPPLDCDTEHQDERRIMGELRDGRD